MFAERMRVLHAQPHEEIMRVLAVGERDAIRCFAGLEEQRITLFGDGAGLEAGAWIAA